MSLPRRLDSRVSGWFLARAQGLCGQPLAFPFVSAMMSALPVSLALTVLRQRGCVGAVNRMRQEGPADAAIPEASLRLGHTTALRVCLRAMQGPSGRADHHTCRCTKARAVRLRGASVAPRTGCEVSLSASGTPIIPTCGGRPAHSYRRVAG